MMPLTNYGDQEQVVLLYVRAVDYYIFNIISPLTENDKLAKNEIIICFLSELTTFEII